MLVLYKNLYFLLFLFSYSAFSMIIDKPGTIDLGGNLIEIGTDVITITCSNVILDLNENAVAGGINGIKIEPNLSNIIIRNGGITSVTNAGISVGEGCSSITLQKLKLSKCVKRGIEFLGTSTTNNISEITVESVRIEQSALSPFSDCAMFLQYVKNLMIFGMQFTNNGSMLAPISLLKFSNCSECLIQNIFAISNYGNSLNGIEFVNPINCALRDSIIANLKATNNCNGIKLSGESVGNVFRRVSIFNNTAGSVSVGFNLEDNSISNVISDCQVVELTGGSAYGYAIHGSNSIKNVIGVCSALNLDATQPDGFSVGFYIDGASSGTINECASSYNTASSGLAAGVMFSQANGGNFWNVNECKIVRNIGIDESNSFGINALAGAGNLFLKNFAYDNGSNPSNQMIGVPNGSVSQLNISNLNSAPTPWANVVIIP